MENFLRYQIFYLIFLTSKIFSDKLFELILDGKNFLQRQFVYTVLPIKKFLTEKCL